MDDQDDTIGSSAASAGASASAGESAGASESADAGESAGAGETAGGRANPDAGAAAHVGVGEGASAAPGPEAKTRHPSRWRRGVSGCPSGGWETRRAKKRAKEEAERLRRAEAAAPDFQQRVTRRVLGQFISVPTAGGGQEEITRLEGLLRVVLHMIGEKDPPHAQRLQALKTVLGEMRRAQAAAAPAAANTGVLVVGGSLSRAQWEAETGGARQSTDPLEGTNYAGAQPRKRERGPAD